MSPDDERGLPSLPARRIAGPVFVSVVLHGALLYLLARTVTVAEAEGREERPSVRVSVVMRLPPPVEPEVSPPEIPEPEVETPPEPQVAETVEPAVVEQAVVTGAEVEVEVEESTESTPPANPAGNSQPWTPARIRGAIETHASERRSTATATWLTGCFLEQKEHGTRDCEQQLQEQDYASASMSTARDAGAGAFASVVRRSNDWRMTQQFMRSNAMLEELAEVGGVVGALATDRILINNEYMRYLQGNVLGYQGQDPLWQAMNSGFTADVLGGRRLSLPGNIPFRCGSGKLKAGMTPGGVGVSDIVPCVFEFTGFTIERPEQPVEQNAFRVVPIVPGSPPGALAASSRGNSVENPITP